ncbi:MAG: hypothetical protein KAJ75_02205, partial [Alphaproteobacteria bacterium]|nr:hypothetical protein [Alphaproteobacteria bacterium]
EGQMSGSADDEAERNDFSGDNGTLVVNNPPTAGQYTGDDEAVEVVITETYPVFFMSVLGSEETQINVRAVATTSNEQMEESACVLALDNTACGAIKVTGNGDITLGGCVLASNSDCDEAIIGQGNGDLNAFSASVVGGTVENGSGELNFEKPPATGVLPVEDPYADLETPVFAGCDHNNFQVNGNSSTTLSPGVYCDGLHINEKGPTTMNSGVYIIDKGEFRVNAQANVVGEDVTIILTSSTGADYATVHINGACDVDLTAPDSGDYSGILFYGDRDSEGTGSVLFNGTANMNLEGALYFPSDEIEFKGNSSSGSSCTQIIGSTVTFTGSSELSHDCEESGTSDIHPYESGGISLVE